MERFVEIVRKKNVIIVTTETKDDEHNRIVDYTAIPINQIIQIYLYGDMVCMTTQYQLYHFVSKYNLNKDTPLNALIVNSINNTVPKDAFDVFDSLINLL